MDYIWMRLYLEIWDYICISIVFESIVLFGKIDSIWIWLYLKIPGL